MSTLFHFDQMTRTGRNQIKTGIRSHSYLEAQTEKWEWWGLSAAIDFPRAFPPHLFLVPTLKKFERKAARGDTVIAWI